jgi:GNAT superfamily N-acetyltransferase
LLSELGARTFYEAFVNDNTPEDIELYLRTSFSPDIQLQELAQADIIFLIAESGDLPHGYAQLILNSQDESIKAIQPMEVRRIYALQEYVGKGVGKALMEVAIEEARLHGCDVLWLGVWEKNQRAIAFYRKWGFREVGSHLFHLGNDPQTDLIMVKELTGMDAL